MPPSKEIDTLSRFHHRTRHHENRSRTPTRRHRFSSANEFERTSTISRNDVMVQIFFRGYSEICQPLYALTKHDASFNWSADCSSAFTRLKECLTSADVLTLPNPNLPFRLYCDCSGYSVGFMVTQTSDNVERVCHYCGRSLSEIEKRLSITDLEMTAVRYGLQKNPSLFRYSKIEIITDHSAIKFILNQRCLNGRHRQVQSVPRLS